MTATRILILGLAAPLLLAARPAAEEIDRAFPGLYAVVEDDVGRGPERQVNAIKTKGCTSRLIAKGKVWKVNWAKAQDVGLGDTFVFIAAPPIKLAIVGDASKPDQWVKLQALQRAMAQKAIACGGTSRSDQ